MKRYKLMKMILLALFTACLPPLNGSSNCCPGLPALWGLVPGRAKTWGSESRQDFEFNDSEENEGEEERADGHLWSYPQPGQECVDVQPEKPGRSQGSPALGDLGQRASPLWAPVFTSLSRLG